jgi:hypothetical protein
MGRNSKGMPGNNQEPAARDSNACREKIFAGEESFMILSRSPNQA